MAFTKATKHRAKLRLAEFGPSGSGKTFTALRIATGLGSRIAVIDTERGSASKYADRFQFDVCELMDRSIESYCRSIKEAGDAGYDVLIIDSLSHAWQELLGEVDKLAKAKFRGNSWSAWSEGTPRQRALVDALMKSPMHIIATMRSKTEWVQETDERGKTRPVKVGLAPEQGKGIEYEFDMLLELTTEHVATVSKDRTGKFQDKMIEKPDEEFGKELAAWLSSGEAAPKLPDPLTPAEPQKAAQDRVQLLISLCVQKRVPEAEQDKWRAKAGADSYDDFPADAVEKLIAHVGKMETPEDFKPDMDAHAKFITDCREAAIDSGLTEQELMTAMNKYIAANKIGRKGLDIDDQNKAKVLKLIVEKKGFFTPSAKLEEAAA